MMRSGQPLFARLAYWGFLLAAMAGYAASQAHLIEGRVNAIWLPAMLGFLAMRIFYARTVTERRFAPLFLLGSFMNWVVMVVNGGMPAITVTRREGVWIPYSEGRHLMLLADRIGPGVSAGDCIVTASLVAMLLTFAVGFLLRFLRNRRARHVRRYAELMVSAGETAGLGGQQ